MGHGNQVQTPVVDSKQAVSNKVQAVHIPFYLFIRCRVSEPQITVFLIQRIEVLQDFLGVCALDFLDWDSF